MTALITGASSGLGYDFACYLSKMGYDLIIVARNGKKLKELKEKLKTNVRYYELDLSKEENIYKLYNLVRKDDISLLINNAGFGVFGEFYQTNAEKEINLIDLNIKAVHLLTKLFLIKFKEKDNGRILNVASSAAFMPGPLLSSYYASKSYVYNLSLAIYEELRRIKSNVKISVLCPGPVNTNFNNTAGVTFKVKAKSSKDVVKYTIKKMFKNKLVIIPGIEMKVIRFFVRFIGTKTLLKITYNIQKKKIN